MKNKFITLQQVLIETQPDVATIQEANIYKNENLEDYQIPGYKLILDKLYSKYNRARTVIYISEDIRFTRREDLETETEPIIVLTIYPFRATPFNFFTHYRQWQIVTSEGALPNTGTPTAQKQRYSEVIQKWINSIKERETIYNGDDNIDLDKNYDNNTTLPTYEKSVAPLFKILRDKIYTEGVTLIRTPPTKHYLNKNDTYLDHIFTTHPAKIYGQTVLKNNYSDHYPVTYYRKTQKGKAPPAYILSRDYKLINWKKNGRRPKH